MDPPPLHPSRQGRETFFQDPAIRLDIRGGKRSAADRKGKAKVGRAIYHAGFRVVFLPLKYLVYFFIPHSRIRFTREGAWFFFMTLGVGIAAINTGIGLLYLMVAMMLSFIIVSGVLSELSLMMLRVKRGLPGEVHAHQAFFMTFQIQNCKRLFPSFSVHIIDRSGAWEGGIEPEGHFLKIPAGESAAVQCLAMMPRRGLHLLNRVAVRTEYPFGFFIKETDYDCEQELLVYPPLGNILDGSLVSAPDGVSRSPRRDRTRHELEEFHTLREYRTGDNPKWIHWRSSARLRKLMLREFETRAGKEAVIYLDTPAARTDDEKKEEALEYAVSFAATLINELYRKGYSVTLACASPQPLLQSSYPGKGGIAHLFRTLALVGTNERGLRALMNGRQGKLLRGGLRLLVTTGADGGGFSGENGEGLRVIGVSHPSFRSLFSLPALEGSGQ